MKADCSLAQVRRELPAWRGRVATDEIADQLLDAIEEHALASTGLNCCEVARIKPCVCEIARTCAVHGDLHRGSHD